jgi:two-component system, NarL family, invasion response regulator UvrY
MASPFFVFWLTMNEMTRIIVVDDHVLIREGLKKILREEPDLQLVAEGRSAADAVELVANTAAEILILDLCLPDRNGLEVIQDIKRRQPQLPILVLSVYSEESFGVRTIKAGADGYLAKTSAAHDLVKAIRKVVQGGKYVSPALAEQLVSDMQAANARPVHQSLSDREFQILREIAGGKSISRIAEELHLSVSTVNTYRSRILEKLNMRSNAELIHYSIKNGLIL